MAVLTNTGVIIFSGGGDFFDTREYSSKLIAFIAVEVLLVLAPLPADDLLLRGSSIPCGTVPPSAFLCCSPI